MSEKIHDVFYPVTIILTDEVRELLKSNEAKHYLKEIEKAGGKLQRFIMQNLKEEDPYAVQTHNRSP